MVPAVTWRQALAWRMERQLLDPIGTGGPGAVVDRLCGVQAQLASTAELAIRLRRRSSRSGEVQAALEGGTLLKTWAMRGTLHLLTPRDAGAYLAVIAATRPWEKPAWERWAGLTPAVLDRFRSVVRDALEDGPKTREELAAALAGRRGLAGVRAVMSESWGTILKPLAWLGDLCIGPSAGGRPTFARPDLISDRWRPLPDADAAAKIVVSNYFAAYGPAPEEAFVRWMGQGWFGKRALLECVRSVSGVLVPVDVDGQRALVRDEDLDSLLEAQPSRTVRLLAGFDQYVLGPGTDDGHVIAPARRRSVSRQSGWIAPVILRGGFVGGTWELDGETVRVEWFAEAGRPARTAIAAETERLSTILGRELRAEVSVA